MYLPKSVPGALNDILTQGKSIHVDSMMLVRSSDTDMKWYRPSRIQAVFIRKPGEFVEIIRFSENDLSIKFRRITGTENPYEEIPNVSDLHYTYEGGSIIITGENRFCERVYIPTE